MEHFPPIPTPLRTVKVIQENLDGTESWIVEEPDGSLSHEQRHLDKPATISPLPESPDIESIRGLLNIDSISPEEKIIVFPIVEAIKDKTSIKQSDRLAINDKISYINNKEVQAELEFKNEENT